MNEVVDWARIKRLAGPNDRWPERLVYCFGSPSNMDVLWLQKLTEQAKDRGWEALDGHDGNLYLVGPKEDAHRALERLKEQVGNAVEYKGYEIVCGEKVHLISVEIFWDYPFLDDNLEPDTSRKPARCRSGIVLRVPDKRLFLLADTSEIPHLMVGGSNG